MEIQRKLDKIRQPVCTLTAIILFALTLCSSSFAVVETKSSPNYLIILVHGINSTRGIWTGHGENGSEVDPNDEQGDFGDLKGYLENTLGLKGYVYAYTFSERDGSIALLGKELGKRDHHNKAGDTSWGGRLNYIHGNHKNVDWKTTGIRENSGNCWLEQAREDFINWFKTEGPGKNREVKDPLPEEIPQKYILICHSMGGLVARQYLSSNYYNNNVVAIITIDSQHLGSDGAQALAISEYLNG